MPKWVLIAILSIVAVILGFMLLAKLIKWVIIAVVILAIGHLVVRKLRGKRAAKQRQD
jgi:Flp pilus assembly protein TadB